MVSGTIVSLAILKVNWDLLRKGYLDNFVPIVAECIRLLPVNIISLPDLQGKIYTRFGLNIPQNAIRVILKRVRKRGFVRLENKVYKPNTEQLAKLNFGQIQQQVLEMHESLIRSLIEFCSEKFGVTWTVEEAELALQSYLRENEVLVLNAAAYGTLIPEADHTVKTGRYSVGMFVRHLQETRSPVFEHFETVVKGNMLANAIFLPDPNQAMRKFQKTEVYFDTSFLIYVLGWAGQPRKDPCTELLQLLYETGADLRCFRHTLEEINGILDFLARRMSQAPVKIPEHGPSISTVEYFLSERYTPSDIELLKVRLEKHLQALRVRVVDKPPYLPKHVIDEEALDEALKNIPYRYDQARLRDVDSIAAIIRLRRGEEYSTIEDCRAVFVTTNIVLAKQCHEFFCAAASAEAVSPCLTDYTLTNVLWLKKPLKAPDLPRKRIIADCYAATQPNDSLWRYYLTEIEKLEKREQLSTEDYYFLRYSLESKQALMELTLGEEEAFTEGTVQEILELARSRIQAGLREQLETERKRREKAEQEIETAKAQMHREMRARVETERKRREEAEQAVGAVKATEVARMTRIRGRAQKWALAIARVVEYGVMIGLIIGTVRTFPWELPSFTIWMPNYAAAAAQIILLGMMVCNLVWGSTVKILVRRLEIILTRWIENRFLNLLNL